MAASFDETTVNLAMLDSTPTADLEIPGHPVILFQNCRAQSLRSFYRVFQDYPSLVNKGIKVYDFYKMLL